MHLTDLLTSDRVAIQRDEGNGHSFSKSDALALLASLLATGSGQVQRANVERVLVELREGATGEHLKTLARVSRLLRNRGFREQLVAAPTAGAAYDLIAKEEADQK